MNRDFPFNGLPDPHDDPASSVRQQETNTKQTRKRGFAAMDPQLQREIASKGGRTAHQSGAAYTFDSEAASKASRKGWENRRKKPEEPQ